MRTTKPIERRETLNAAAPLISVIVPIYNVERYVRKCLDSLRGQTLREIEIICIDDGNTDGSGKIADEYAAEDERFRVMHTENRGLSAARNRGIDEARSQWLMFVDSDDWVESEYCRIPYEAAVRENADLVIFNWSNVKRGRKKSKTIKTPAGIIDWKIAVDCGCTTWNKLYKKVLFHEIQYPEGRVYEDNATTHKVIHKATKILKIDDELYHHRLRKESISHDHSFQNMKDGFISALERCDDLLLWGYPKDKINASLCSAGIRFIATTSSSDDELYLKAIEIVNETKEIPKSLSTNRKIAVAIWKINPKIFQFVSRMNENLRA